MRVSEYAIRESIIRVVIGRVQVVIIIISVIRVIRGKGLVGVENHAAEPGAEDGAERSERPFVWDSGRQDHAPVVGSD